MLSDVQVPWERCAEVFGPQKGADPDPGRSTSTQRLDELTPTLPARSPRRADDRRGRGPVRRLWAVHKGRHCSPAPRSSSTRSTPRSACAPRARSITGEGKLDEQTLQGKLVGEIGTRTRQAGVPLARWSGTDPESTGSASA